MKKEENKPTNTEMSRSDTTSIITDFGFGHAEIPV
jgi:hypothetical protein